MVCGGSNGGLFTFGLMAARFTPVEASERNKEVTLGDLERHQDLGSTKSTIQTGI